MRKSPFKVVYRFTPRCLLGMASLPILQKIHAKVSGWILTLQEIYQLIKSCLNPVVTIKRLEIRSIVKWGLELSIFVGSFKGHVSCW